MPTLATPQPAPVTDEVTFLREALEKALTFGRNGILFYQRGSTVSVPGATVHVISDKLDKAPPTGPGDFWDFEEQMRAYLESGVRPGQPCSHDIDGWTGTLKGKCPNFQSGSGEDTFWFSCDVCGRTGSGEFPE